MVSGSLIIAGGAWLLAVGKSVTDNSGPALSAVVDIDPLSNHCYALADPVTTAADRVTLLSGTASAADVMTLIRRHGGVLVGRLDATLILEGNRSSLRIVDIQPQILAPQPAPAAALVDLTTAGSVSLIPVTANLDGFDPVLDSGSVPYFDAHEIDLVRGERESFRISFRAATGYFRFDLLVTYVTGGKQYQQTIPGPFRLAGTDPATGYRTVYAGHGVGGNQYVVATRSQARKIFSASGGC